MRVLADSLASDCASVKVYAEAGRAGWLVADFSMPTQAQYQALPAIERAIQLCAWRRMESTIAFPRSPEEQVRAERKLARAKARRRARRERGQ
jgi:hypothetical protein